jgi:hypothetical protein
LGINVTDPTSIGDVNARTYSQESDQRFDDVAKSFLGNCTAVNGLIGFDATVLSLVIDCLEELHARLKKLHASDQQNGGRVLTIVRNIRDNESLRSKYQVIYGQAVVLLVSHFASAMADLFRASIAMSLESHDHDPLLDEDVRITFREMREKDWNLRSSAADLLIAKKDLTFQDMQSISRAFSTYLGVQLEKDQITNNIILGQAARHVLVHASGIANDRMVRQVSSAKPRTLKPKISAGDHLSFSSSEVLELMGQMKAYLERAIDSVKSAMEGANVATGPVIE